MLSASSISSISSLSADQDGLQRPEQKERRDYDPEGGHLNNRRPTVDVSPACSAFSPAVGGLLSGICEAAECRPIDADSPLAFAAFAGPAVRRTVRGSIACAESGVRQYNATRENFFTRR